MADKDENGFLSNEEVPRIYLPEHFADMEDLFEKHFVLGEVLDLETAVRRLKQPFVVGLQLY